MTKCLADSLCHFGLVVTGISLVLLIAVLFIIWLDR